MFAFNDTLTKLVLNNLKNGQVPFLVGNPGIGKSAWVESLARQTHTKCFVFQANEVADKADVTGGRYMPVYDADGQISEYVQTTFPHEIINDAINYAKDNPTERPILFFDETNRTSADVTSLLLSIPTRRAIASKNLPDNLCIICAGNDRGNVIPIDTASRSRFVIYPVGPDLATFLAKNPNLHPAITETLNAHPETLYCERIFEKNVKDDDNDEDKVFIDDILDDDESLDQITTPRTLSALSNTLNELTAAEILELLNTTASMTSENSLMQDIVEAHVGHTMFTLHFMNNLIQSLTVTSNNATPTVTVPRPLIYDQLANATTMTELNEILSNASPSDCSGSLVYALSEDVDRTQLISTLLTTTHMLEADDIKVMMSLASTNGLNRTNLMAFLDADTPLSNSFAPVLRPMVD